MNSKASATRSFMAPPCNPTPVHRGPAALKAAIQATTEKIVIPALNSSASNQAAIDNAKRTRVQAAIFLSLISPEFAVQK